VLKVLLEHKVLKVDKVHKDSKVLVDLLMLSMLLQ
jgi:hypothetical protein